MIQIENEATLRRALEADVAILMKDSPRCLNCAVARRQLRRFEKRTPGVEVYLLNVLSHRPLSDRVAEEFHVRHESPQAFVLERGRPTWHTSHFGITWRVLAGQVAALSSPTPESKGITPR